MERGVITEIPLYVIHAFSVFFSIFQKASRGNLTYYSPLHSERGWGWGRCEFCERKNSPASLIGLISSRGCVLFLTENTEEQNTQHSTETLSQPISQNLIANISWNVLWILYAGGLLWVRNVRKKGLSNLWVLWEKDLTTPHASNPIGVTSHTTPLPAGEGKGEGPLSCGIETVRQKAPWTLCALWEKKLPSELFVCYLIRVGAFYFSQRTQKNRTHSIPQRH